MTAAELRRRASPAKPAQLDLMPVSVECNLSEGDLQDMLQFFENTHDPLLVIPECGSDQLPAHSDLETPRSPSGSSSQRDEKPWGASANSGASSSIALESAYGATLPQPGLPTLLVPAAQLAPQGSLLLRQVDDSLLGGMECTVGASSGRDAKLNVSHSTIEKQRRDRINSLIDQLRDLVPASASVRGADGTEMKRPKHVVLSDTIRLLKHMQDAAVRDQQELKQLRTAVATSAMTAAAAGGEGPVQVAAPAAPSTLELPTVLGNVPAAVGVVVEEGDNCFHVKVNCKDRHGLLNDITHALKDLPLQITRAAITTSAAGSVYDVFEIHYQAGSTVSAMDVQYQLHNVLYAQRSSEDCGVKRSRSG